MSVLMTSSPIDLDEDDAYWLYVRRTSVVNWSGAIDQCTSHPSPSPSSRPINVPLLLKTAPMHRVRSRPLPAPRRSLICTVEHLQTKNGAVPFLPSSDDTCQKQVVHEMFGTAPLAVEQLLLSRSPILRVYQLSAPEKCLLKMRTAKAFVPSAWTSQLLVTPKGPFVAKAFVENPEKALFGRVLERMQAMHIELATTGISCAVIGMEQRRSAARNIVVLPLSTSINLKESVQPCSPYSVQLCAIRSPPVQRVQRLLVHSSSCTSDGVSSTSSRRSFSESEDRVRRNAYCTTLNEVVDFLHQFTKDIDHLAARCPPLRTMEDDEKGRRRKVYASISAAHRF